MENSEKKVSVKLPISVIDLFRDIYNLSEDVFNTKVLLYAIGSNLPDKGRRVFAKNYYLDIDTLNGIVKKRKRLTNESYNKEFKSIEQKLSDIDERLQLNGSSSSQEQFDMILLLLRLLLADNFSLGTDKDSLNKYLSSDLDRNIMNFVQEKLK
ncbi:hypothetical protein [Staphylococcus capitis]|uniref:hypothetical protein n=1 Tax=Staphylococcus capitis TaxID=29388 RepID=UPI000D1A9358|nr:hypothetical protein [Staphylococcus capitis]PTH39427.1 hypothetical protein BU619_07980 [Staphylococcus capitis]